MVYHVAEQIQSTRGKWPACMRANKFHFFSELMIRQPINPMLFISHASITTIKEAKGRLGGAGEAPVAV